MNDRNRPHESATIERFGDEAFFESLLEHTTDGVLTIDESSTIVYANRAVQDILGYEPSEIIGESLLRLVPPEIRDEHLDGFSRYLRTGERSFDWGGVELPGHHKDGHSVPLRISFQEYTQAGERLFTGIIRDIGDRKVREEELERYETLVQTADDSIYQLDSNGRFVAVNEVVTEVTGYSRDELLGESVSLVLGEDDIADCADVIRTQLTTDERGDQPVELEIQTADGGVRIGELRLNVLRQDGEFQGTVGIVRDITEWKQDDAERRLLHSTTRSIAEAETTVDGLQAVVKDVCEATEWVYGEAWVPAADGSHLVRTPAAYTVSDAYDRFKERSGATEFGPHEGLPGRVWATKEPEWTPNVSALTVDAFPRKDAATDVGLKAALGVPVTANGRVVAVLAFYMAEEKTQDNRLVDIVSTVATNLGTLVQRKQQEDALKRQREELARRHDQLQSELEEIFDRVNEAFFGLNPDWEFTYVNPQAEETLRRSAGDLVGRNIWEELPDIADSAFRERYERAMETQESVVFEAFYEPLETWFEQRAYPSETGLSVYFRDVTERKEREQALERQNDRLESFASMLAHELRNPLTIAQIYHPQAVDGDPDAAEEVATALDRIERMIDILLVTARGADSVIEWEPIGVRDVAREAWGDGATDESELVVDAGGTIQADRTHVRHLFENLFRNAIEHGGEDVTIRVGELADGFYVEDDGAGVPEADRETVFEAGHSTEGDGIGLGLTFVAQLADTYGWECRLTEGESGGARFEFRNVEYADADS